jgi:hypothetical protein
MLYPFNHAGPWTEELAFRQDLWSGVAMIGYVVCTVAGIGLVVCLLLCRQRPKSAARSRSTVVGPVYYRRLCQSRSLRR